MKVFPHFSHVNDFFSEREGAEGEMEARLARETKVMEPGRMPTFVQVHVLLQGVFGGQ